MKLRRLTVVNQLKEDDTEPLAAELETLVKEDEPRRLRRLIVLSDSELRKMEGGEVSEAAAQFGPDPGVVGRTKGKLEACLHSEVCCDVCFNVMPFPRHRGQRSWNSRGRLKS